MSKGKKITLGIFIGFFCLLTAFLLFWYLGATYPEFYANAQKEFEISGLSEGFTPQGIAYDETTETFLSCGYMKDGSASRIYVMREGKTVKYFTLTLNEQAYVGHAGGIATDGQNVWISGDGKVLKFAFADVASVLNGQSITVNGLYVAPNGADFVTVDGQYLWIGEFHRDGKYDTNESHHIKVSDKKTNKAMSFKYKINSEEYYGFEEIPVAALSTPSLVQGIEFTADKIILSTSYSLPDSHLYIYSNILSDATSQEFELDSHKIPLYVLSDETLTKDMALPCMSEEIVFANDKLFVMFESACQKYKLFTREPLKNVYSLQIA